MYAFKKSGIYGDYDVVDELNVIEYIESLPFKHSFVEDVDDFKRVQAQYFTPSNLKQGLSRSRANVADIQGVLFDLDFVPNQNDLKLAFYELLTMSKVEAYLWLTPSGIWNGKHRGASRIFIPLAEPIVPELLSDAVDELLRLFATLNQKMTYDLNLLDYGVDIKASKTVGRLMGLPVQQEGCIVPWDIQGRFRYKVKAEYKPSQFKPVRSTSSDDGFLRLDDPTPDNLQSFILSYCSKHGITWQKGQRDDNLMKVIGAVKEAFSLVDEQDLLKAFYETGIASNLDNPEKDILGKTRRLLKGA